MEEAWPTWGGRIVLCRTLLSDDECPFVDESLLTKNVLCRTLLSDDEWAALFGQSDLFTKGTQPLTEAAHYVSAIAATRGIPEPVQDCDLMEYTGGASQ